DEAKLSAPQGSAAAMPTKSAQTNLIEGDASKVIGLRFEFPILDDLRDGDALAALHHGAIRPAPRMNHEPLRKVAVDVAAVGEGLGVPGCVDDMELALRRACRLLETAGHAHARLPRSDNAGSGDECGQYGGDRAHVFHCPLATGYWRKV